MNREWKEWVKTNVERGCDLHEIKKILKNNNFSRQEINYAISEILGGETEKELDFNWKSWVKRQFNETKDIVGTVTILLDNHFSVSSINEAIAMLWNVSTELPEYNSDRSWMSKDVESLGEIKIINVHDTPVIRVFENILSPEECDEIVSLGKELTRAKVCGEDEDIESDYRTNSAMSLEYAQCPASTELEKRIAGLTGIPVENGERLQLLQYSQDQEYKPHHDYFYESTENGKLHIGDSGQRVATVVTYLSDVIEGGETHFPTLDITIRPKKGDAVYFEYVDRDGIATDKCLHAGLPVKQGTKYVVTKWLRQKRIMSNDYSKKYK